MTKEKSINMKTEEFRSALFNIINQSNLPVSIVYYVFKDVGQELENIYYGTLNSEAEEIQEYSDPSMKPDSDQMPDEITKEDLKEDETE